MSFRTFASTAAALILCADVTIHGAETIKPAPTPGATVARGARSVATNRIVGGEATALPFMAALVYRRGGGDFQYCGASVLDGAWLLTAAHCQVQVGDSAIVNRAVLNRPGGVRLSVTRVIPHPGYDTKSHDNDIALVRLEGVVPSEIEHVVVGAAGEAGEVLTAAGWGLTAEDAATTSLELRKVNVPVVSATACCMSYSGLTANMLCAGAEDRDSCQGDSGGPLFRMKGDRVEQVGITSFGVGCGRKGWPGVYTAVANYREWISATKRSN